MNTRSTSSSFLRKSHESCRPVKFIREKDPCVFSDHPRQTAVIDNRIRKQNFHEPLSLQIGRADHQKSSQSEEESSLARAETWQPTGSGRTPIKHGSYSHARPQSCLVANRAPSDNAFNLAQTSWRCSRPPRPQSVPAMTFSRPIKLAKRRMRSATSSGCSTTLVA